MADLIKRPGNRQSAAVPSRRQGLVAGAYRPSSVISRDAKQHHNDAVFSPFTCGRRVLVALSEDMVLSKP